MNDDRRSTSLNAVALNCTLKKSPSPTSCELMLTQLADELRAHDVETEIVRVVDLDIKPGVKADEGDGDDWPGIRAKILAAQRHGFHDSGRGVRLLGG